MPVLIDRQRRLVEVGVLRVGERRPGGSPTSRETWRLTSASRGVMELAREVFGGELRPWEGREGHWELLTDRRELRGLFSIRPRGDGDLESLTQWFERWAGNTCTHRCNGSECQVWRGDSLVAVPCECDPAQRECKLVSRVSVILPELPSLGVWRLNTGSRVFDEEAQGLVQQMRDIGLSVAPVVLAISFREKRTARGQKTSRFPVVRITLDPNPVSLPALIESVRARALAPPTSDAPALGAGVPALPATEIDALDAAFRRGVETLSRQSKRARELLAEADFVGRDGYTVVIQGPELPDALAAALLEEMRGALGPGDFVIQTERGMGEEEETE